MDDDKQHSTHARSGGPTFTPALSAWLEEIREYLSSRQDVNDGSDGPRPNEEMTLLANLDEALRRPTFPNGNTAGPSAVEEVGWLVENGSRTAYRTMENGIPVWTPDVNKALRFARRVDAELFCAADEDARHVAEHIWG